MRTSIVVVAVVALALGATGCGGDDDPADGSPGPAATSSDDVAGSTDEAATTDCATQEQAAAFSVNGQLVSQFASLPTSKWSTTIGKLDELDEEVAALSTLQGDEVQEALAIYEQIPPIIEAGLDGDTSATGRLAALIGTDPVEALKIKNTIILAYGEQCAGAG